MNPPSAFDPAPAHRFFAADCFNKTWAILDKPDRSTDDDEQMRLLSHASLWHWTQREDCTDQTLSIGYWLISRVYAVLRQAGPSAEFAEKCLRVSGALPPFYQGYAHEARARAAKVTGEAEKAAHHVSAARQFAAQVADPDERAMLEQDLEELG